jgi:hypothetical protein
LFVADSIDKWLVIVQPVPGPVIEFGEMPYFVDTNRRKPLLIIVPISLTPEQVIHDLRRFDQYSDHFALIIA